MKSQSFQEKLKENLCKFKDNIAIENGIHFITYGKLDERTNYIANWLMGKGIKKETFIGVLTGDRVESILLMVAILKAGCVFVPLDPNYPNERLTTIIGSIELKYIFIDEIGSTHVDTTALAGNQSIEFIFMSDLFLKYKSSRSTKKQDIQYCPEGKIYIYFTSGTTGVPKAVLGKSKSLLHYIEWEVNTFRIDESFRVSQLSAPGFDAFLKEVFAAFFGGGTLCVPKHLTSILVPEALLAWVEQTRINLFHCVPGLFRLLNSNPLAQNNLTHLKYVLLSGENIYPSWLKNWYETFDDRIQLFNLYGVTETTILKTYYPIGKSDVNRKRIPIGKPIPGARIIVMDKNMNICNEGIIGEIYIRTPYMTFGYYNDPGLNMKKFIKNPFNDNPNDLLFKTGDLGRFLLDGNVELTGRIDRQVKIRGIRIELEEIESVLINHPSVKEAAAIKTGDSNHNERLFAFITAHEKNSISKESSNHYLKEYLQKKLPPYMIPSHIIAVDSMPRLPNGKVDYETLLKRAQEKNIDYVPPINDIEKKLITFWSEILKMNKIGTTSDFFELGGNSLNLMSLIAKIHKEFDVRIPIGDIFNHPTVKGQAKIVSEAKKDRFVRIEPVEKKRYYSVSPAQKRIYILQQMDARSTHYNMPVAIYLDKELTKGRLEKTFKELVKRHESLRTSFEIVNKEPVQKIHVHVKFQVEYYQFWGNGQRSLAHEEDGSFVIGCSETCRGEVSSPAETPDAPCSMPYAPVIDNFVRPFDLTRAPLLRVGLVRTGGEKHILMVDMHHIISDGSSHQVLREEFQAIINGAELPGLKLQYKDYSEWLKNMMKDASLQQEDYWLREFSGTLPVLDLPTDYPRPVHMDFEGDRLHFHTSEEETRRLKKLALEKGITPFMMCLVLFIVLLHKLTGQKDIIVGTDNAGRSHPDLKHIIGMFVNTLALRHFPTGDKSFATFLEEIKQQTLEAFENRDYPFEKLVEKVLLNRNPGRNPLFDAAFFFFNVEMNPGDIPESGIRDLILEPYNMEIKTARFDLALSAWEMDDKWEFFLEYRKKLFTKETIETFALLFKEIAAVISEDTGIKLKDIDVSLHLLAEKTPEVRLHELEF